PVEHDLLDFGKGDRAVGCELHIEPNFVEFLQKFVAATRLLFNQQYSLFTAEEGSAYNRQIAFLLRLYERLHCFLRKQRMHPVFWLRKSSEKNFIGLSRIFSGASDVGSAAVSRRVF